MTTLLCRTHDIYDQLCAAHRKSTRRKVNRNTAARLWDEASRIAEREQAQTLINREAAQVIIIGAAVDAAYAPLLAPTQSHEAATWDAIRDVRRAAHEATRSLQDNSAQEAQR